MYQESTLQMEWCLNCHRNPAKNLRPTAEIYNMAWTGPSTDNPVWCGSLGSKSGVPTAETVNCTTSDPSQTGGQLAALQVPPAPGDSATPVSDAPSASQAGAAAAATITYTKFTDQYALGNYLVDQYHIRTPRELSSCEVCHR
jgi:hypothetical protein